ncbi:histone deacetylase complex subunit SAP130-like isoform X1 [Centruroides sculpturatus]|uniref:histone deacetylase complex subunit SAP130-like isoform X1 n=1 Tax=Centruroides sculpturatus TaxID=218467 RepID=UPI000C6EBED4|nr:histone deacetylase complex subunit SAP130-like isoform X1 [Centruroides sculpturatus]XP_023210101.1 histone deacetylase complex subunit SAP130-like isoform X1 [Centruroides sculpturatus]
MPATQKLNDNQTEPEEGGQSQPIDLAQRVSLSSSVSAPMTAPTGPVTMRTHVDPSKPSFMTLHMRVPAVPRPSVPSANQIISSSSMLPASVASAQHLAKPGTSTSYASSAGTLASSRHGSIATMHPVVTLGPTNISGNATMTSIIRGTHSASQAMSGHLMNTSHMPFSSHVPRGPAAVASISTAPKSAVATPVLRPAHTSPSITLPVPGSAAVTSSHVQITPRSTVSGGRTATPPIPKAASPSLSMTQVIDLQKSTSHVASVGHLSQTRTVEPTVWSGITHNVASSKQVHISQPIVQHLQQQVSEQGFYKASPPVTSTAVSASNQVTTTTMSSSQTSGLSIIHHSSLVPPPSPISRACTASSVVTIAAAPHTVSSSQSSTSRPTLVPSSPLQIISHTTSAPLAAHPTLTVMSAKGLSQMVHTVTPLPQQSAQAVTISAPPSRSNAPAYVPSLLVTATTSQTTSTSNPITSAVAISRTITTGSNISQPSIPVAKVYPQQLPTTTHSVFETSEVPRGNIYVAQPQQNLTSGAATVTTVVLSDNRNESGASVRFASRTFPIPSRTFYYESFPVQNTITMHQYTGPPPTQNFAAAIPSSPTVRAGIIAQHASGALTTTAQTSSHTSVATTNVAPVRPMNSVMVTVDPSRHHVALHSTYGSSTGAGLSSSDTGNNQVTSSGPTMYTVTNNGNQNVGLITPGYGSQQGQGSLPNHSTSPRPSILRKRACDGMSSAAKKNLMTSLPVSGPASPHLETTTGSTIPSPKSLSINDQQRENNNTSGTTAIDSSDCRIPTSLAVSTNQDSSETTDQNSNTSVEVSNKLLSVPSVPVEASPRKKPRKQQLAANELIEAHSTDGEEDFEKDVKDNIRKELIKEEEENVKWVTFCKRPTMSLLSGYQHTWKSRHNHFLKYSDVKPKEEKRQTVNDLVNQKGVLQKANGWKMYHLTTQMDEVVELEDSVYNRLSQLLDFVENNPPAWKSKPLNGDEERVLNKISDLIKGNLQRSKIVQDQVGEAKLQVLKMLEHRPHIVDIISKYISKRTVKKKEKN